MANFIVSLEKVLENEGGYVNNKNDKGGETFKGISRKYNPNWEGWGIIDNIKNNHKNQEDIIKEINNNEHLEELVEDFYKENYWNKIKGDDIKNQRIATIVFDTSVNMGVNFAIKSMQQIIGVKDDGIVGSITLNKLNNNTIEEYFVIEYKTKRLERYCNIVSRNSEQIIFCRGWIKRTLKL